MLHDRLETVLKLARIALFSFNLASRADFHHFWVGLVFEGCSKVGSKLSFYALCSCPARCFMTADRVGRPSRPIFSLQRTLTLPENRASLD